MPLQLWFEEGIAPYPIYRISDGKELKASKQNVTCKYCEGIGRRKVESCQCEGETIEQVEDRIRKNSPHIVVDSETHTLSCWTCGGKGIVEEVIISVE